jgi:hypothetical protein
LKGQGIVHQCQNIEHQKGHSAKTPRHEKSQVESDFFMRLWPEKGKRPPDKILIRKPVMKKRKNI